VEAKRNRAVGTAIKVRREGPAIGVVPRSEVVLRPDAKQEVMLPQDTQCKGRKGNS
jgi:hypothetical protein